VALIARVAIEFAAFREDDPILIADLFVMFFAFVGVTDVFDLAIV
jgi:hypothetical protein